MYIVFASHSADLFGAERNLVPLVEEAVGRGHRVAAVAPRTGPLCGRLEDAGAEVRIIPTRAWMGRRFNAVVGSVRLAQAMASVPRYRRFLGRERPAVLVTNSAVLPAPALAARHLGVPHLWLVQESVLTNPTLRSVLSRRRILRQINRWSDRIVGLSGFVAGQMLEAVPEARSKLTIIAASMRAFPRVSEARRGPAELRRLLVIGRLSDEKGQRDALGAIAACAARGVRLEITLAGVGSADGVAEVRRLAARHGIDDLVRCVAWSDDPVRLFAEADVTLMLSRNEAFGRITVESLMTGTPVIGYRRGCTTELLSAGGGILIEPGVDALAAALLGLAADQPRLATLRWEAATRGEELRAQADPAVDFIDLVESLARAERS